MHIRIPVTQRWSQLGSAAAFSVADAEAPLFFSTNSEKRQPVLPLVYLYFLDRLVGEIMVWYMSLNLVYFYAFW